MIIAIFVTKGQVTNLSYGLVTGSDAGACAGVTIPTLGGWVLGALVTG